MLNDYRQKKKVLIVANYDRVQFPSCITFNLLYPEDDEIFTPSSLQSFSLMVSNYCKLADEVSFKTFQISLSVTKIKEGKRRI